MKTVAIIQARMGSIRLPKKVMSKINGMPMIEILLKRLSLSKELDQIIVATSKNDNNKPLIKHVNDLGYECYQGSESNVLSRYAHAAKASNADIIVRITGDCPLIDPQLVDELIIKFKNNDCDYLCNVNPPTYPDGLDIQITFSKKIFDANTNATSKYDKEHVMPYIYKSESTKCLSVKHSEDLSKNRWTVDEKEDLIVINEIFDPFKPNIKFSWQEVLKFMKKNPKIFSKNKNIKRNEGADMGEGQKLWEHAKKIIPGGNMLLSKRAEMYLPNQWPAYFKKAKGCEVLDLEGNKYVDTSLMGVGPNILGYGDPDVDAAVIKTVNDGNMSTLNCAEEVMLADKLIEINPWADMVRYARSGGEANAISIRIARAATGKDNVAVCGYHGWHDWYLSANLANDDGLKEHLLGGLSPNGVPKSLKNTVHPFSYNDINYLKELIRKKNIGTIKMEVYRNVEPKDDFLIKVRKLATDNNIVLIFDECTSGFRETYGGLHKKYNVEPDMAMFGKAMGNGYAITATIGKRSIMECAQSSFISSTFWSERIGPTAAIATLKKMKDIESWKIITEQGIKVQQYWKELSDVHNVPIKLAGLPALSTFSFNSKNHLAYKTFLTQSMLEKGYLATTGFYLSTEHSDNVIENYINALDPVFKKIKKCEEKEVDINELLKGPICHDGFKRLN